jgi:hypothetical protein
MAIISPICKKCKNFISALKSPAYIYFMINPRHQNFTLGHLYRAVRQKFFTPGISELSVQNIRDSGEMPSKDRCKTIAGSFVIPLLSQL